MNNLLIGFDHIFMYYNNSLISIRKSNSDTVSKSPGD